MYQPVSHLPIYLVIARRLHQMLTYNASLRQMVTYRDILPERICMALIDRVTGIMYCGDDEEIFMDILGMYVGLVSESRQILAEALFDNRMEDYIRRVHAVKSNSRSVGALAVGDLAEKIERAARESRKADVMEDHQELIRMLSQVEAEAQQILNSNS